jgi:membrane-associated phospholipid phosphatase
MANGRYSLRGTPLIPQVEPDAGFWCRSPVPRAVSLEDVRREVDHRIADFDASNSVAGQNDLAHVKRLATHSEDANFFRNDHVDREQLSTFLLDAAYVDRPPVGAVVNRRPQPTQPFLKYGAELSRLFETETPGLWHRHVLNVLLAPNTPLGMKLSPPRQALVWAVLDVAISSALQAAWYYKWAAIDRPNVAFRERPWEADNSIPVLFDYAVAYNNPGGDIVRGNRKPHPPYPVDTPGTPRHPAYPSGHSTYSAAASTVLGCLFPKYRSSFNLLANNIGRARLWAGVHWFGDHMTGQLIGQAVGNLVIAQLNRSGIERQPGADTNVPDNARIRQIERDFYRTWRDGQDFCQGLGITAQIAVRAFDEHFHELMNPGSVLDEQENGDGRIPPADDVGELDVSTI